MPHAHFFPGVAVQMSGCRLFVSDPRVQCHLSGRTNSAQHIRGRRPAGHHSVKHVKCPAEPESLLELTINACTSQITAPGGLRVWRSTHRHQTLSCVIDNNFQHSTMLIFSILPLFFHCPPHLMVFSSSSACILHFTYSEEMDTLPINQQGLCCTQAFRCAD